MSTTTNPWLGLRGTGDWPANWNPQNWREGILYLYPNGKAPLTALTNLMGSKATTDPQFNWWEEVFPTQRLTPTGVYTNSGLSTPYTSGDLAVGSTLYVKFTTTINDQVRVGHQILLRDASNYLIDTNFEITAITLAGSSSYLTVKCLETVVSNHPYTSLVDTVLIVGNINAEGVNRPGSVQYDPTQKYNYTQIFRTSYEITGTAENTETRGGVKELARLKKQALEMHSVEMEKAFLWGCRTETVASVGGVNKPKRATQGLINYIRTNNATGTSVMSDYSTETGVAWDHKTWLTAGKNWLNYYLEQVFRYGSEEKLAFCGSGALLGIQELAEAYGTIQLVPGATKFGLKVLEWITPFGVLILKTHPLFSYEATNRNSMVIFEPSRVIYRYLQNRDTKHIVKPEGSDTSEDTTRAEFKTEAGLEFHNPECFAYLNGVGLDNA